MDFFTINLFWSLRSLHLDSLEIDHKSMPTNQYF